MWLQKEKVSSGRLLDPITREQPCILGQQLDSPRQVFQIPSYQSSKLSGHGRFFIHVFTGLPQWLGFLKIKHTCTHMCTRQQVCSGARESLNFTDPDFDNPFLSGVFWGQLILQNVHLACETKPSGLESFLCVVRETASLFIPFLASWKFKYESSGKWLQNR